MKDISVFVICWYFGGLIAWKTGLWNPTLPGAVLDAIICLLLAVIVSQCYRYMARVKAGAK